MQRIGKHKWQLGRYFSRQMRFKASELETTANKEKYQQAKEERFACVKNPKEKCGTFHTLDKMSCIWFKRQRQIMGLNDFYRMLISGEIVSVLEL